MPPIMLDLLSFSKLLDATERTKTPKLDPLDYTETILSLLYRLVDASPLRQAPAKPGRHYGDVKYLAMLSFMTTLLPGLAHNGSNFPFLSDSLARAIQDLCATESASSDYNSPLILWILFISGISVLNMKRHPWLSPLIADSCRRLDLEHWDDIQQHLSQFPWIFSLHKAPGRLLWEDVSLWSKKIPLDVPSRELS
jgi:hypothetical protein